MKNYLITVFILIVFSSCNYFQCENTTAKNLFLLVDISDPILLKKIIKPDLSTNFNSFVDKSGISKISPCQTLTVSIANLSSKDNLDLESATIGGFNDGMSQDEVRNRTNPQPLLNLINKKLSEYDSLCEDSIINSKTNIANVLVKTLNQANPNDENTFLIISDFVQNVGINLYKEIPSEKNIAQAVEKIIEQSEMKKLKELQQHGFKPKMILVLKEETSGKVAKVRVKAFWIGLFTNIGISVQFIDELNNSIK